MHLEAYPLSQAGADAIIEHIRRTDCVEVEAMGITPHIALSLILLDATSRGLIGDAWEVRDVDAFEVLGVFGYHRLGSQIYSLWRRVNADQAREILNKTAEWVTRLVEASGRPFLSNYVDARNRACIRWLERSECFEVLKDRPIIFGDREMYAFRTLPSVTTRTKV